MSVQPAARPPASRAPLRSRVAAGGVGGVGIALGLLLAPACQTRFDPEPTPVTPASAEEALEVVRAEAAERDDLALVEGGLVLDAWFYVWRERTVWEDSGDPFPGTDDLFDDEIGGRTERVRGLEGPRRIYVPLAGLRAVAVRAWTLGAGVELELAGEPEPAFLRADGRERAERLGSALEVLRRAHAGGAEPTPPGAGTDGGLQPSRRTSAGASPRGSRRRPVSAKSRKRARPRRWRKNCSEVHRTPKP